MTEPTADSSTAVPRNRLAAAQSPYLRQHATNPVDWYPWGEEAFARARAEDKPIFLSIGYSTCHWCHVMAHESFENPAIAAALARDFVSVKVDREERPDVDRLYMAFVQATTGHGGWPLSVWLTPELEPFYGGTYYPPEDRWGRPGFPTLLARLAQLWREERGRVRQQARESVGVLRRFARAAAGAGEETGAGELGWEPHQQAFAWARQAFDEQWGGFGGAPKFPRPVVLNFLQRIVARRDEDVPDRCTPVGLEARRMVDRTLQRMAEGGLRDHLGGGFHRYSVDGYWHVPHYEKMLYDQAQLAVAYLEGWQATGRAVYAWIAHEILDYVRCDLALTGGAYAAAEDADSLRPGAEHPAEGAFYVWDAGEIAALAGADAELVRRHYDIRPEGNAPEGADPHGELRGWNTLRQRQPLAQTAHELGLPLAEAEARLLAVNERLRAARSRRPRPARDDKVVTAWNGLLLSAFARAAQVLAGGPVGLEGEPPKLLAAAERAAAFLQRELWDAATGHLRRSWCGAPGAAPGFADDYAALVQGLLDLYEATGAIRWLQWADQLQATMDTLLWDEEGGGYFGSPPGDPSILVRMKEDYDGAEPAPASIAALNLLRLAAMLGDDGRRRQAEAVFASLRGQWSRAPHAVPQLLVAMDFALGPVRQIVLAGSPADPGHAALRREVHRQLEAPRVILWADGGEGQAWLAERVPFLRAVEPLEGKPTAYVCRNFTCQLPTTDPAVLARQMA
jgi:uncharacterized protein YyaL (SSP411 family)